MRELKNKITKKNKTDIYVMDTDIYQNHNKLKKYKIINSCCAFENRYEDNVEHGIGIASIIAGKYYGLQIRNAKVFNGEETSAFNIIKAINCLLKKLNRKKISIINISFEKDSSKILDHAFKRILNTINNVIIVAAAGDDGNKKNACHLLSAHLQNQFGNVANVGAINKKGKIVSF